MKQKCFYTMDIKIPSQEYFSFNEVTDFATAMQNPKGFTCQEPGHTKAWCTNKAKRQPPREAKCSECDENQPQEIGVGVILKILGLIGENSNSVARI